MEFATKTNIILLVDDEAAGIVILSQTLKRDYEVVTAVNGFEALERARDTNKCPDLILLDVQMPGMDGFAVCKKLQEDVRLKDIPIIFLTSLDDIVCKTQAFAFGAVDYITKPYHLPEVQARVRTHISLKLAREELLRRELELKKLSITDDLTGLYNTRYLYQGLFDALKNCMERNTPLSCIFIDLDHFKYVVDTYGHLYGSLAIQEVAATIKDSISSPAFAVSYAGDEFVIILPDHDKNQAHSLIQDIEKRMASSIYLSSRGLQVSLSASFGCASYPEDGQDPRSLLARADEALFEEKKRRGANRTV